MPSNALTDLVHYLNTRPEQTLTQRLRHPFVSAEHGAFVHFAGLRLESRYQPLIDTHTGAPIGHAASLWAEGLSSRKPLAPEAVFVLPTDDEEFVYLDRLLRTLHALNYLTQPTRGTLLLKVHQRHVLSVPANHGLAFEELLRPVGLLPSQITLEIETNGTTEIDRLAEAIGNYRERGYGIAIAGFGRHAINFDLIQRLRPDIVKLDPWLLSSTRPLKRLTAKLHELGAQVLIDGLNTRGLRKTGAELGIHLLQVQDKRVHLPPAATDSRAVQARTANTPAATQFAYA